MKNLEWRTMWIFNNNLLSAKGTYMERIWPTATQEQRESGWTIRVEFLEAIKKKMDSRDPNFSGSLEVVENCLISAAKVEIDMCRTH